MPYGPYVIVMVLLILCSAFFSCSEAALFYLQPDDRRALRLGNRAQRAAVDLLAAPKRLLTAILFWNLIVNLAYFAVASMWSLRLEAAGQRTEAGGVAIGALLLIIFCSEMLPKNVAVLRPRLAASIVSLPLSIAVRMIDPCIPAFQLADTLARRLFFPHLVAEPYIEIGDLERAITLSTTDQQLVERERIVLQNVVSLSDLRVEELMRPRTQYQSFSPPVRRADLNGRLTPSGYLLVTELESDDVTAAIRLDQLVEFPDDHLEYYASKVVYVPWCAQVGTALEELSRVDREVAAVVNEFGETIGIITIDDIYATIFQLQASRSERLLQSAPIVQQMDGSWLVTGMTTVRRLAKHFDSGLPSTKNVTVGGVLQEELQRVPESGDEVYWGGYHFTVLQASPRGPIKIRVRRGYQGGTDT